MHENCSNNQLPGRVEIKRDVNFRYIGLVNPMMIWRTDSDQSNQRVFCNSTETVRLIRGQKTVGIQNKWTDKAIPVATPNTGREGRR